MEQFKLNLVGETLTIVPVADGGYSVYRGNTFVTNLTSELADSGVIWKGDGVNPDYAKQIGELIEEHDM